MGLQAASNTIRGLGTGEIAKGEYRKTIEREIKSGMISATIVAIAVSAIGGLWSSLADQEVGNEKIISLYPFHNLVFAGVLFFATLFAMTIACFNGSATPMVATSFGLDPTKTAGPLETALQDIFGQTFLLAVSFYIFRFTEPYFW